MSSKLFISHASEDKDDFVRPLAHTLKRRGVNVWYDEFSLKAGDSLRRSIDKGLLECDVGVVVLSPSFFRKEWPQRELDALLTGEIDGAKRLLPVWHSLDAKAVAAASPMLADKVALRSDRGADAVAEELISLLPNQPGMSGEHLASVLECFMSREPYILEFLRTGCQHRFLQIQAFFVAYQALVDQNTVHPSDEDLEDQIDEIILRLEPTKDRLLSTFGIPSEVECVPDEVIPEVRLSAWMQGFEEWVSGTQDAEEAASFLSDLDIYIEVDHFYLLFGLPNYAVSETQRELLDAAIKVIGTWVDRESPDELERICSALRSTTPARHEASRG